MKKMRILIATDAWTPQVNGVVRTLSQVAQCLEAGGDTVHVLSSEGRRTFALPSYPEIRLCLPSVRSIAREVEAFSPDAIHIATEGPIGHQTRRFCLAEGRAFTTSYHSRFPEYLAARVPLPMVEPAAYAWLRKFHGPSERVLAPTATITNHLTARGFANAQTWTRGVDHQTFRPDMAVKYQGPGPFLIHCGRLAPEKNVGAFLSLDVPGQKIVIGDGPSRASLQQQYPDALFLGYRFGADLAAHLAGGDVFVFPSRTDTFGLVMIEAMACGLPVAAFPVPGPLDVVTHGKSGWLHEDLAVATREALALDPAGAVARAATFTWDIASNQFRNSLVPSASQAADWHGALVAR